jgi:hypothetical protein
MGIIVNDGRTRNMDFNSNDAGFVPRVRPDDFADVSVNNWIRRWSPETATAHMNIDKQEIARTLRKRS